MIGGTEWSTKVLEMTKVMNQLQSPTLNLTNAALTAASTFRTGLSTQLSPPVAMAIHAIRWNFFIKNTGAAAFADQADAIVGVLSEDVGATSASAELTDPRTLAEAGIAYRAILETAVGGMINIIPLLWSAKFDPPIWTIAQNLRILGEITEEIATSAASVDVHLKIHYTVEPVSQAMLTSLIQRLNLAVQP